MFINDIHIFWYIGIGIFGLIVGRIIGLINERLPKHEKIFSVDVFKEYLTKTKPNYIVMIITCIIYLALLRIVGVIDILRLIEFIVLTPMLISVFCIDYKLQIVPNRLTLTMWEFGLIFSFIRGIGNLNAAIEMWIGMILGASIFLILTFVGNLIFKKETMGFGDVKLMGALGLFFGWRSIIAISILSFLIAALYSLGLIIYKSIKKQEVEEFIPFGPFIVLASFILIFVPLDILIGLIVW